MRIKKLNAVGVCLEKEQSLAQWKARYTRVRAKKSSRNYSVLYAADYDLPKVNKSKTVQTLFSDLENQSSVF